MRVPSSLLDRSGNRLTDEAVAEIVRRIACACRPERVVMFGFAAAGEMTPDSDIDLLMIEREVPDIRQETLRIRRALGGLPAPFDVIVMSTNRFEGTRDVIGGIAWPAARSGRVILEAA